MKKLPSISILIPTSGPLYPLMHFLESLKHVDYPKTYLETIIVNTGLAQKVLHQAKKEFPQVKILTLPKYQGFSHAINVGSKKASGTYIFITNDDITLSPDYFKKLAAFMRSHPEVGAAGGLVYSSKNKLQLVSSGYHYNMWTGQIKNLHVLQTPYQTDWVQGCQLLTPRNRFNQLGGFDEQYFFYFEDADYCKRLQQAGLATMIVPKAHIYHNEGTSIRQKEQAFKLGLWYASKFKFIQSHATTVQKISSISLQLLYSTGKCLLHKGPLKPALQGLMESFKNSYANEIKTE